MIIKEQIVLDKASTAEEAIDVLKTQGSIGVNFIISDSNIPKGYAVETTASLSYNQNIHFGQ